MNDNDIIDQVAKLWVELGGDSFGFEYNWRKIRDRIRVLNQQDEEEA
jgi:hypothetical protein